MFDIEPVTIVLSLLLFGAFTAPFVYHSSKKKKKTKALESKLNELAKAQGANLSLTEIWRNYYVFGLDPSKNCLIYFQDTPEFSPIVLDLNDFKKVGVIRKNLESKNESSGRQILDYLALELTKKSGGNAIQLEFYNGDLFSDLMGETLLADKWLETLQKQLK